MDPLPTQIAQHAKAALDQLHGTRAAEGKRIHDASLNAALAPLRSLSPLPVACGRCGRGIAYWAIAPGIAAVISSQRRAPSKRRGHSGSADLNTTAPHPAGSGKPAWIEQAETETTTVTLVDVYTPGYPLRLRHTCPKCEAEYVHTNTARLRLYLSAQSHRSSRISL